jgi:hypothetical protein
MNITPSLRWAALTVSCLLGACTIAEMRADNDRRQQQVQTKESDLQREQQTQSQLQAERQRLLVDLKTRELTVSELKQRLQEMQRLNTLSTASTPEQVQNKARRTQQLNDAAAQVRTLEQDSTATQQAKAKKLEEVRRQLRTTLELMANT